jgi:hypothetical protein
MRFKRTFFRERFIDDANQIVVVDGVEAAVLKP